MRAVQPRSLAGRLLVFETVGAMGVELHHPIPHDLQRHATDLRSLGPRRSVVDRRASQRREGSSGPMDEQLAQIAIATLGDPDEARFAPCRYLSRHEAKPCGKVSSAPECLPFTDCRGKSRRVQHADAGDRRQAPCGFIVLRACCKLVIEGRDALIDGPPFLPHALDQLEQSRADCETVLLAQHRIELAFEITPALRDDYAPARGEWRGAD
jgi:hypothetical protein